MPAAYGVKIVGRLPVSPQSRGGSGIAMFEKQLYVTFGVR
jgi:hypothetical protein